MASEKISAMPAATDCGNADLLTTVQGGVNKKTTRVQLFTSKAGENVQFVLPDGSTLDLLADGTMAFNNVNGGLVEVDPDGSISIGAGGGTNLTISGVQLHMPALPTSDPGVAGQLYALSNVIKVSAS